MVIESILPLLTSHWHAILGIALIAYLLQQRFQKGLNRYPGPLLASFTNWWRFWDVYKRRPEVTHIRLHRQLGDVVRLGPNCLSFADPQALKSIYGLNKGFIKVSDYELGLQSALKKYTTVGFLYRSASSRSWSPASLSVFDSLRTIPRCSPKMCQ